MTRKPDKYTTMQIRAWKNFTSYEVEPGTHHYAFDKPARPLDFEVIAFFTRLKMAWRVFTGKYDVLDWEE